MCASWHRGRRSRSRSPSVAAAELDPAGEQDRAAEGDLGGEGVGQAGLERRQAAGLGPHPVRDRRREAERLRGQRVHVDRVAVAGDGGVAAAEVAAELPLGRGAARRPGARRPSPACARRRTSWRPRSEPPLPRRSIVLSLSQTSSSPARASVIRLKVRPLGWGCSAVGPDRAARAPRRSRSGGAGRSGSRGGRGRPRRTGSRRRPSPPCAAGRRARAGRWGAGGRGAGSRRPGRRRRPPRARRRTPSRVSSSSGISPPPPGRKGSREAPGIIGAAARA